MKLIDQYFEIQKQIYNYFGYVENWRIIPIDDSRNYFWCVNDEFVRFADSKEDLFSEEENFYENVIYRQRFLNKWVYRTKDFTMICADTNTDGNKLLQIFDNSKEFDYPED